MSGRSFEGDLSGALPRLAQPSQFRRVDVDRQSVCPPCSTSHSRGVGSARSVARAWLLTQGDCDVWVGTAHGPSTIMYKTRWQEGEVREGSGYRDVAVGP